MGVHFKLKSILYNLEVFMATHNSRYLSIYLNRRPSFQLVANLLLNHSPFSYWVVHTTQFLLTLSIRRNGGKISQKILGTTLELLASRLSHNFRYSDHLTGRNDLYNSKNHIPQLVYIYLNE